METILWVSVLLFFITIALDVMEYRKKTLTKR